MDTLNKDSEKLLSDFVDQLIVDKGLPQLEPEVLEEIKKDLLDRLEIHVNAGLLALLPETAMDKFDALLDQENKEATQTYLHQHIPNLDVKLAELLVDFKQAYIAK